ncbi:MAG TPA: DNA primase [Ktedonobacteraceae bacterium]|jgi:DNA primase|nr:DNA primase [Ktedonobacteraceae bacterium]
MTSLIEAIKAKIDVAEEVGLVVALRKSGKSLQGLCPFHNERTPSFYVFPESQTWRCFGCNEGGDVFTFVEKQQGLDFRDALHYLAEKAGIAVEDYGSANPEQEREIHALKDKLRKLNEEAALWFHQMLLRAKDAAEARAYVLSRGISAESVMSFSLGYAPEGWDGLSKYLLGQGYTEYELEQAGLVRAREMGKVLSATSVSAEGRDQSSGVYDYFRNRIIFPIRDIRGRVIGFGGRALGDNHPKYLNSPQTLLFEKNNVLYALDMARDAIKFAKQVIIVEGYVDAVIAHQYGTKQTVACIGSAITEKHIQQIKKLTKQVTLALDPDEAGIAATEHGIQEALKAFDRTVVPVPMAADRRLMRSPGYKREPRGMIRLEERVDAEINVLQLPIGEDPDEVIRRDFSVWSYAVAHPLPLVDYYFVAKTSSLDVREAAGKSEAAKRLLPVIGSISDRVKRDAYLRKLATMISIDERSLNEELQRILRGQKSTGVIAEFSDHAGQYRYIRRAESIDRQSLSGNQSQSEGDLSGSEKSGDSGEESVLRFPANNQQGQESRTTFGLDKRIRDRIKWEDYLIGLLLQNPELCPHVCGIITDGDFAGTDTRELYRIFNSVYQRDASPLFQSFEQFVPSALLESVNRARKSVESRSPLEGAGLVKDAVQCATRLKRARLLQSNTELQYLVGGAKDVGDGVTVQQLQQQLMDIHRQLRTIDSAMHLQG